MNPPPSTPIAYSRAFVLMLTHCGNFISSGLKSVSIERHLYLNILCPEFWNNEARIGNENQFIDDGYSRWLLHTVMMNVSLCGRLYTGYTVVLWLCLIMGVFAQMPLVIHSVICIGISNRNSYLLILFTNLHHMTQYIWLKHTNTL